jgi:hypothetical protein
VTDNGHSCLPYVTYRSIVVAWAQRLLDILLPYKPQCVFFSSPKGRIKETEEQYTHERIEVRTLSEISVKKDENIIQLTLRV